MTSYYLYMIFLLIETILTSIPPVAPYDELLSSSAMASNSSGSFKFNSDIRRMVYLCLLRTVFVRLVLRFLLVFDSVSPLQLRTSGPHQATHLTSTFHRHNVETPARCYRSGTARSQLSLTLLYRELVQSAEHPYWALYKRITLVYGYATTKALSECYI